MKKKILLIMATVFMLGMLSACSKAGSNVNDTTVGAEADNKDIEIVDNDEIMIYKLTADNVNSINEKISKYRNIIDLRVKRYSSKDTL